MILGYQTGISWSPDMVPDHCNHLFPSFQLYTAKLYKGRHEFLQLVPKREEKKEPLKTFPLKGVNIKVTERIRFLLPSIYRASLKGMNVFKFGGTVQPVMRHAKRQLISPSRKIVAQFSQLRTNFLMICRWPWVKKCYFWTALVKQN